MPGASFTQRHTQNFNQLTVVSCSQLSTNDGLKRDRKSLFFLLRRTKEDSHKHDYKRLFMCCIYWWLNSIPFELDAYFRVLKSLRCLLCLGHQLAFTLRSLLFGCLLYHMTGILRDLIHVWLQWKTSFCPCAEEVNINILPELCSHHSVILCMRVCFITPVNPPAC